MHILGNLRGCIKALKDGANPDYRDERDVSKHKHIVVLLSMCLCVVVASFNTLCYT